MDRTPSVPVSMLAGAAAGASETLITVSRRPYLQCRPVRVLKHNLVSTGVFEDPATATNSNQRTAVSLITSIAS
jgi:hypothetical protein